MKNKFTHLHVHTEYSLLDGLSKTKKLIHHVKEMGMDSVAITDHGSLYGAIEFYKEAKKQGVNPIIGMEGYTTNVSLDVKPDRGKMKNYHILLLAKNEEGYKNLMKISSIAHLEGYYYRPRFTKEILKKHSKGLICTSSCALGEVSQNLIDGNYKEAKKVAKWHLDVFGKDYYLEIQRHNFADYVDGAKDTDIKNDLSNMADNEKLLDKELVRLSRDLGIPLVATNDSHYTKAEDSEAQDALVCIATGKNVSDTKRLRFIDNPSFYVKSPDEMYELFSDQLDAVKNTVKISKKCDLKISTLGKWFFPKFELEGKKTAEETLTELVNKALPKKIEKVTKEVRERANYELGIINSKGYATYFLIMMDMVNWALKKGIITNTRGSAAGSLVSYALGITTVNPLTYYLPFERFLNPYRPSPPDIDFDVSDDRREEIFEYIGKKYGKDKVAQICTFGRMLSRSSVRDMARVLGYDYSTGDKVAKLIPPPKQGFPITIPKALEEVQELKSLYNLDEDVKKILDLAIQVEGSARHISVHAAAAVISPTTLTDFTPIQREPSGDKVITQYEMHACEDVGLIKFDILGIRNLSILGSAIEKVKETRGKKINILNIPLNDKKTYDMLSRGETMGVFQLSSSGMTKYIKDLQPTKIEELMAMLALYRPGPIAVIPEYIKRKKNKRLVKYLDPRMKKFLDKSYGLIVYQDDLLFCAIDLAGYSWEEADKFRKAVGKKIPEEMAAQKEKFYKGIVKNGQTKKFAEKLWNLFEPFQAYGFNKAHAASYGMVSYQTAYMKANFPVEYMASLLTAESKDTNKVSAAIHECNRMEIKVLSPDINVSEVGFVVIKEKESLNGQAVRFGLDAIKHVGQAAIEAILNERKKGEFVSFAEFLSRVDNRKVNKKVVESLIKVGALSGFGNRASLLSSYEEIRKKVSKPKSLKGQRGLFKQEDLTKKALSSTPQLLTSLQEFTENELENLERQFLGLSLSEKPIMELLGMLSKETTHSVSEITRKIEKREVKIAGIVSDVRVVVTKKSGQEMAFVKVDDGTGLVYLVIFHNLYKETKESWIDRKPLLIHGRVDFRDDEASLLVEKILTEEMISNSSFSNSSNLVYINIPKDTPKNALSKLKSLLEENMGEQKVFLNFEERDKKIELKFRINWNESLAHKISEVLERREN